MFERFTKPAQSVVQAAIAEASRRGDERAGTQHLLVALAEAPMPLDRAVLGKLAVGPDTVRTALDEIDRDALAAVGVDLELSTGVLGQDPLAVATEWPGRRKAPSITYGARDVLAGAVREAAAAGQRRVGAEHILLALLEVPPQDPVTQVFRRLGVDPTATQAAVRAAVRHVA